MTIRRAGIGIVKFGLAALAIGLLTTSLGCQDANRASVTGKVTANGAPVTKGTLSFAPVGGGAKPAMVGINPDGTYDLSGDGVPIGKNTLGFMPISEGLPPDSKPGDVVPPSPWDGMKPSVPEIDIKAGSQTIDIELTK